MPPPSTWKAVAAVFVAVMVVVPCVEAQQGRLHVPSTTIGAQAEDDVDAIRRAIVERLVPSRASGTIPLKLDQAVTWFAATLDADGFWPDVLYNDTARSWWFAAEHLRRCLLMAAAVRCPDSSHANSTALTDTANKAFVAWVDAKFTNQWWWMQIGQPRILLKYLLLLPNTTLWQRALPLVKATPLSVAASWTGCNRVWGASVHVLRACIEHNATRMAAAYSLMHSTISVGHQHDDGLMVDSSFHQHGPQLYSGWGYGAIYTTNVLVLEEYAAGTQFEMTPGLWDTFSRLVLVGQQLATRGPNFDFTACGRVFTYFDKTDQFGINQGHYHYFAAFSPFELAFPMFSAPFTTPIGVFFWPQLGRIPAHRPNAPEFSAFLDRLKGDAPVGSVNKHFYDSDYIVHHRPSFSVTVRMFSNRTINTECINDENKQGRTLADGLTATYITGREYESVFPVWRWKLLPGTTEAQTATPYTCSTLRSVTHTGWVGAASDGVNGVAAMDFVRGHVCRINVSKAWVFYDDAVLALGGGFESTCPYPLATSLEQSNLMSTVVTSSGPMGNGSASVLPATTAPWVWHAGIAYTGIGQQAWPWNVTTLTQNGSEYDITQGNKTMLERPVFGATMEHGVLAGKGTTSYGYAIVPVAQPEGVAGKVQALLADVRVAANTRWQQVVCRQSAGLMHVVTWPAARLPALANCATEGLWRISVDTPSFVQLRRLAAGVNVTVSNPTVEVRPIHVTLTVYNARLSGPACHPNPDGSTAVTVTLADGLEAAESVTVTCM
eukprot:m.32148 g.32148  ORF g.32148 m.32148 type:complete len:778 (-) comp9953_c0_seq2:121-2454(-)